MSEGEKRQTRYPKMKAAYLLLFSLILIFFALGCDEDVERENPLDAKNERAGGVPPGMMARAGDSQVILSWPNMGFDGVKEYRLYQAYLTADVFQQIAAVPAAAIDEEPQYTYTDMGLQNDGDNHYFYRLSFVDDDGVETPDPETPQNLAENWFVVDVIPSEAPPTPDVQALEDTDLQIRLIWEGYSVDAPADLAGFKIFAGPKAAEGQEQIYNPIAEVHDPSLEFYIHGNDYPNHVINFSEDGIAKVFKVVAFDTVGVESDPVILEGTSPNLPPNPPAQVTARWNFGMNSYEVVIDWRRNLESDLRGYVVYALKPDETREFKKKIDDPNETDATISDRYVVVAGGLLPKQYYVIAFDNTPTSDGKRDESEPSRIMSGI